MSTPKILVETAGPVTTITINRPASKNALDNEAAHGLAAALKAFEADPGARVAVLTGASGWHITEAPLAVSIRAEMAPPCKTPVAGSPTSRAS